MKLRKTAGILGLALCSTTCSSPAGNQADTTSGGQTTGAAVESSGSRSEEAVSGMSGTLKLTGPGLFTTVGESGTVDLITGVRKPGYEVVVKRWNELYPNVKLEIEPIPWDNWKAVMRTAALSGDVDVLVYGASLVTISEPMIEFFKKNPEVEDLVSMPSVRKNEQDASTIEYVPYGITVTINPVVMALDEQIFEHYGVELPDSNWTLDDIVTLVEKTTGKDPVMGENTYGISLLKVSENDKNWLWATRGFNANIFQFGEKMKDTKVDSTVDKAAQTIDYLQELAKCTSPDYIEGLDLEKAYKENNNLVMVLAEESYGVYNQIKTAGLADGFMFLPFPKIEDGEFEGITAGHMGDWNMSVCNTSSNKGMTGEFLKSMVTDPVIQQWLADTYCIPNNLEGLKLLDGVMEPAYYDAINEIMTTCPKVFNASISGCWDSINFDTFAMDVTSALNEVFVGNMDAEKVTKQVQANLDEFLKSL